MITPKEKAESQQSLFEKIGNNELETPYPWETGRSALGQTKFASGKEKETAFSMKW